jgi:tryptophan synthase alpha chain
MTYAAIVERHGSEAFCTEAATAGAEALIVPDVPPEESGDLRAAADARKLDLVHLVSLTSTDERIALACRASRGFVYVVSAIGTTGARDVLDEDRLAALLDRVRVHAGALPLLCGFGISSAGQVARLRAAGADGVIVGSAAVAALADGGPGALEELVRELASGLA